MDFLNESSPLVSYFVSSAIIALRYFLFAGVGFLLFYVWKNHPWKSHKLGKVTPGNKDVRREILYSSITISIFGGAALLVAAMYRWGITQMYVDFSEKGVVYFAGSVLVLLLFHDTYFYWSHRLMHHPRIFRHVHRVHHLSHHPTPWAAFAFHPLEAVVEAGVIPLAVMIIPLHPLAVAVFLFMMMGYNVLGHLGYETFPKGFVQHPLGKWSNTSTHHHQHHRAGRYNFGLYFNFWDRVMGTNHPGYEQAFEEASGREREAS
jgi:sterol desaturase/sphingolipid hydroxylase (fatty acid hydroxylase superfamily)